MEFIPYPINLFLSYAFLGLLSLVLFLNVFGLPANWLILGLTGLWVWLFPVYPGLLFWVIMIGLAVVGEGLEFVLQVVKARKYGSSSSGTFGGIIGAIAGAILLAPLFWGIGAFIGALAGAWAGCLIMELCKGRPGPEAFTAAFGTMMGRFLGTVCKIGIGAVMIVVTANHICPTIPQEFEDSVDLVMIYGIHCFFV